MSGSYTVTAEEQEMFDNLQKEREQMDQLTGGKRKKVSKKHKKSTKKTSKRKAQKKVSKKASKRKAPKKVSKKTSRKVICYSIE